jgi:predicted transcriptional regulator
MVVALVLGVAVALFLLRSRKISPKDQEILEFLNEGPKNVAEVASKLGIDGYLARRRLSYLCSRKLATSPAGWTYFLTDRGKQAIDRLS